MITCHRLGVGVGLGLGLGRAHLPLITFVCGGWQQRWACACRRGVQRAGVRLQRRAQVAGSRVRRVAACCSVRRPPRAGATAGLLRGSPTPRRQHTAQAQVSAAAARDRYSLYCPMPRAWVAGGRAGGRAAHRHRQLLLVGELLIVVRKVVTLCRLCLTTVGPAHAVLIDRRVDELAVVQADLVRRERAGREARLPAREPAHAASALPPRASTAWGCSGGCGEGCGRRVGARL